MDNKAVHFVFVESAGETSLQFIDLRKFGVVPLTRLAEDARLSIGDPVFSFSVPHDHISSAKKLQDALNAFANEYIQGLLKSFSREASEMGEVDERLCFVRVLRQLPSTEISSVSL